MEACVLVADLFLRMLRALGSVAVAWMCLKDPVRTLEDVLFRMTLKTPAVEVAGDLFLRMLRTPGSLEVAWMRLKDAVVVAVTVQGWRMLRNAE